jgi:hypothetical protein
MPGKPGSVNPSGHYELRDHPTLDGLVVIWWCPVTGQASPSNMTLGKERIPLLAEACADWELAQVPPPRQAGGGLRAVRDDGTV